MNNWQRRHGVREREINRHLGKSRKRLPGSVSAGQFPCSPECCLCQTHPCRAALGWVRRGSLSSSQQSVVTWHIFTLLRRHVSSLTMMLEGLLKNNNSQLGGSMLFILQKVVPLQPLSCQDSSLLVVFICRCAYCFNKTPALPSLFLFHLKVMRYNLFNSSL